MSSKIANIRTYHKKYFNRGTPTGPEQVQLTFQRATSEGVLIADDGRAYAPYKRPLTKKQMQAINARRSK